MVGSDIPSVKQHRSTPPPITQSHDAQARRDTHHILLRSDKLDDTTVQLGPPPPIRRLVGLAVPIEQLRDLVAQVTHAAFPPRPALDERDVGVDVGSTAATSRDDRVRHDGDGFLRGAQRKDEQETRDDQPSSLQLQPIACDPARLTSPSLMLL